MLLYVNQFITPIDLFYKYVGFYLEGVWRWTISGSYSQETMGLS